MKMSWRSRVSTHAAPRGCRGADLFFLFSPGIKSLCKSLNIQLVEITETVYGSRSLIYICTLPFLASNSPGGRSRPRGPTATRDAPLCSPLTHLIQQIQQCGPTFHTASRRPETTSPTRTGRSQSFMLHEPPHPYGACNLVLAACTFGG